MQSTIGVITQLSHTIFTIIQTNGGVKLIVDQLWVKRHGHLIIIVYVDEIWISITMTTTKINCVSIMIITSGTVTVCNG